MKRSRSRRKLKWILTIVASALLVLTALCSIWGFGATHRGWSIGFGNGVFCLARVPSWDEVEWLTNVTAAKAPSWSIWLPRSDAYVGPGGGRFFLIPLWLPLAILASPAAWLWYRDSRHAPPGHCPTCSYDLTGNTTGICPECGHSLLNTEH